ncbi:MAG: tetratricopeptide repeat protein [Vulcanimicrobiaceae bacterium]
MRLGLPPCDTDNFAGALQAFKSSLARYRRRGDQRNEARALTNIGLTEKDLGRYAEARQSHQQALALVRCLGDHNREARALTTIGNVEEDVGNYAEALPPTRLCGTGGFRTLLLGQGMLLSDPRLIAYGMRTWLVLHAFVVLYEEPTLRKTFAAEYGSYCARVARWLPRSRSSKCER